nr:unnamed protein product [Callosobruchus chinensis]
MPSVEPVSLFAGSPSTPALTIDAKPFTPNYQSPFQRQTGLYQSLRTITNPTCASPPRATISSLSLTGNSSTTPLAIPYKASSLPDVQVNIPTYTFKGKPRGRVLIINNVKFIEDKNDRKGAEHDQLCLKHMFEQFGYKVNTAKNLTKKEMSNTIKSFRKDSSLKNSDICVVIIMSHGTNINKKEVAVAGGYTEVIGVDNKGLPIDEVLNEFSGEMCQYLKGKPKIFFFQCCRGEQHETLAKDAKPVTHKCHADMLIAHSTLPGFVSLRDEKRGSWYIQCIHEVFTQHAKNMDVESMLKIVDDDLSRRHPNFKQTSSYECRGFKRCYLL